MKPWQTLVRYGAIVLAVILIVNIATWGLKLFGVVIGLTSSGNYDKSKIYEFDTDIDCLDIDISAASLVIRYEKCDKITVKSSLKSLTLKESFGKLRINDNKGLFSVNETESWIEIMLPEGTVLRDLDLDLGAGKTLVSSVSIRNADIDGGAGELLINRCIISELDLDMGVGKLDFRGKITDRADIDLGVGEADFIFIGNRDDYRLKLEKGIGSVSVEGEEFSRGEIGNGDVRVDVDGGIGKINVSFLSEPETE